MSASFMAATATATLWSSPPLRSGTFFSSASPRPSSRTTSSMVCVSSTFSSSDLTSFFQTSGSL